MSGTGEDREAPPEPGKSAPERVLVTGWSSFLHGEATAGDVGAAETVGAALRSAGIPQDVAWSPVFRPEGLDLAEEERRDYSDLVVTTRLRGLVLALRNGVPALAVDPVVGGAKVAAQGRAWDRPVLTMTDPRAGTGRRFPGPVVGLVPDRRGEGGRAQGARAGFTTGGAADDGAEPAPSRSGMRVRAGVGRRPPSISRGTCTEDPGTAGDVHHGALRPP